MDQDRSAVPQAPRCPSPDSPDAGVLVLNWMGMLPVSPGARYVYALIYQYSADGAGCYAGGAVVFDSLEVAGLSVGKFRA